MGIFEWMRTPMGIKNAPSYFQQGLATRTLSELLYKILELYMDDICVHAETVDELIANVRQFLLRCRRDKIFLNSDKAECYPEVEFVGHLLTPSGISFTKAKLDGIRNFLLPNTQGELKSFLGLANYFVKNHYNYLYDV